MNIPGFLVGIVQSTFQGIALVPAVLSLGCSGAFSQGAIQLQWEMLVPPMEPLANSPDQLPLEQQEALRSMLYWKGHPSGDLEGELALQREEAKKTVNTKRENLARKGVDLDALYVKYVAWATEVERRGTLTEQKYDGKRVAITGYLLPLDFDPAGTTEFLLVPYFGACIHEPPPPPNQVIYLKSSAPYTPAALFEGVILTGTMRVQSEKKELSFVDGSDKVASGYRLESESIVPYQSDSGR